MTEEFRVDASDFERVGKQLVEASKELQKTTRKAIRSAVRGTMRDVVKEGSAGMPARGGLAERLAASRVAYAPTSDWAGLRVILGTRQKGQLGRINRGLLRHPVFARGGDRKAWTWVAQTVPSGTYTDALNRHVDEIKRAELAALQEAIGKVSG